MVEILNETRQSLPLLEVETSLKRYLSELGVQQSVTLVLCDDEAIRALNAEHRGVNAPTDVLSYPLHEPDDVGIPTVAHLGDVFISVDTAARQASEHDHSLSEEVLALAAHGVCHLRGFDHPTEDAWQVFHRAQRRVLEHHRAQRDRAEHCTERDCTARDCTAP